MSSTRQNLTNKNKQKKKEKSSLLITAPNTNISAPINNGGYCTADQCFPSHRPVATTSLSVNTQTAIPKAHALFGEQSFKVATKSNHPAIFNSSNSDNALPDESNKHFLSDIIPAELATMIKEATKQGILTSCLLTLCDEIATEYLKARHYKPEQIYWINQAIRTLALLSVSTSYGITIATPIANYVLTTYVGLNKENAAHLTTGTAVAVSVLASSVGLFGTSMTIAAGIGSSFLGAKATKHTYNLAKQSIFSVAQHWQMTPPAETKQEKSNLAMP
jgi:hypothetical protein